MSISSTQEEDVANFSPVCTAVIVAVVFQTEGLEVRLQGKASLCKIFMLINFLQQQTESPVYAEMSGTGLKLWENCHCVQNIAWI